MSGKPLPSNAELAAISAGPTPEAPAVQLVKDINAGAVPSGDLSYLWFRVCKALGQRDQAARLATLRAFTDDELIALAMVVRDGFPVVVAAAEAVMANYGPEVPPDTKALADHQLTVAVYRVLDEPGRARLKGTPQ